MWWYMNRFLALPPQSISKAPPHPIWIKIDATYFGSWGCFVVYRTKTGAIYWRFVRGEYVDEYVRDLRHLQTVGYRIAGVTSDWHGSIVAAVRFLLPTIPHQRCLVHTQRLVQGLLTRQPKTGAGQELLELIRFINQLPTHYDAMIWKRWLLRWKIRHELLVKHRSYATKDDGTRTWWYTHKNVRRAFRTVWSTQEHLFLYLDHNGLDKDTNDLEGLFAHLKEKLGTHRGLTRKKKIAFLYWYFHFKTR